METKITMTLTEDDGPEVASALVNIQDLLCGLYDLERALRSIVKYEKVVTMETIETLRRDFYDHFGSYLL